jgi:hypothetical protein
LVPAAVRTFDSDGTAGGFVFDLDAKTHTGRAVMLSDCARLTGWLHTAGCAFFVDESPHAGRGRHVYVLLDHRRSYTELSALARRIRIAGILPSFDSLPMLGRTDGCIRPPGSAHKHGGHQTLITPLDQAITATTTRSTPTSWDAFVALLPLGPPPRRDLDVLHPINTASGRGPRRELTGVYADIARTGNYDTTRYQSPSEARMAVIMHAIAQSWTEPAILHAINSRTWPGLAELYQKKYGTHTTKAISGDISRALARIESHPFQRSHTRAPLSRGETKPHPMKTATRLQLKRTLAALQIAITENRWGAQLSYSAEYTLLALLDAGRRKQSIYTAHGCRSLSYTAGSTLTWPSIARTLRLLHTENDPFLVLIEDDRGAQADLYELRIPDAYLHLLPHDADLPDLPHGVHPVYSELPRPAHRLIKALQTTGTPMTASELQHTAHVPLSSTYATLNNLLGHGLLRRTAAGAWALTRLTLDRLATRLNIGQKLRDILKRTHEDRRDWHAALGLPDKPRRIPKHLHYPGTPPGTPPTQAGTGPASPVPAPSRPPACDERPNSVRPSPEHLADPHFDDALARLNATTNPKPPELADARSRTTC